MQEQLSGVALAQVTQEVTWDRSHDKVCAARSLCPQLTPRVLITQTSPQGCSRHGGL